MWLEMSSIRRPISNIDRKIRFAVYCLTMAVRLGMGSVGYCVHKFTWQWVGSGRVSYSVGWVDE